MEENRYDLDYATVPDLMIPVVILLDTSASMSNYVGGIREITEELGEAIARAGFLENMAEHTWITLGGEARMVTPFRPWQDYEVPALSFGGGCALNRGIPLALDVLKSRMRLYRSLGLRAREPTILFISNGKGCKDAQVEHLREVVKCKGCKLIPVAVGADADFDLLKRLNRHGMVLRGGQGEILETLSWVGID